MESAGRTNWDADWEGAREERSDEGRLGSGRGLLDCWSGC